MQPLLLFAIPLAIRDPLVTIDGIPVGGNNETVIALPEPPASF
jgi:hypothetical protein